MAETVFSIGNLMVVLDIALVAVLLYWVMLMFKGTRAERMFWGLAVVVLVYFVTQRAELLTLHWIISNFLGSIAIFIIVVFQQDIRRALVHMGRPFSIRFSTGSREFLEEVTRTVFAMAGTKTGALVVLERSVDLTDFIRSGVALDAAFSQELILSLFNPASPLHDGAVVISGGRVSRAGCILPLAEREMPKRGSMGEVGTRHRAALGLAEETDAVIIVVSEQTGEVTLVEDGEFRADVAREELMSRLETLFATGGEKRSLLTLLARRAGI